ncbi:MAG: DUF805 domain-containing protein [Paracoccus sp. (in: a-proteobacteria)]|uniref:DUF805 domain-containing protein n=1 Tax=Paracoccus sp. TaxID=267 RepID=UPI00391CAD6D
MNMFEAVSSCFSKYVTFSGRARRSEFWYFTLFNFIVAVILFIVAVILGFAQGFSAQEFGISDIYSLATFLPALAVTVRRLHDIGRSGWWVLIMLIPLIGWIILIVWHCTDGERSTNRFGPDPKAADTIAIAQG